MLVFVQHRPQYCRLYLVVCSFLDSDQYTGADLLIFPQMFCWILSCYMYFLFLAITLVILSQITGHRYYFNSMITNTRQGSLLEIMKALEKNILHSSQNIIIFILHCSLFFTKFSLQTYWVPYWRPCLGYCEICCGLWCLWCCNMKPLQRCCGSEWGRSTSVWSKLSSYYHLNINSLLHRVLSRNITFNQ